MRGKIIAYARERYAVEPEYLWLKTPDAFVLRNTRNKKWYALVMGVRKSAVGLDGEDGIDLLNVKCSPLSREVLIGEGKAIPAYHMNKLLWLSVFIDKVSEQELYGILDESYDIINENG